MLLCDTDKAYADALTEYLIASCKEYRISAYTSPALLSDDTESYDITLISEEFMDELSDEISESMGRVIVLTGDPAPSSRGYETLFKFQSMESLVEVLRRSSDDTEKKGGAINAMQRMIGIYSPMKHELMLPFALAVCNILSQEGRVLFIDLEDLSILPDLVEGCTKDMLDLLYLLEHKKDDRISDYIGYCEGFSYLAPMRSPSELAYVTASQWNRLFEAVSKSEHDTVVILFDHMLQGFEGMIAALDGLVLLGKEGGYYKKSEKRFMDYLWYRSFSSWIRQIDLPLNASNLGDEGYTIGQLLHGNLGSVVRRAWENGTYVAAG